MRGGSTEVVVTEGYEKRTAFRIITVKEKPHGNGCVRSTRNRTRTRTRTRGRTRTRTRTRWNEGEKRERERERLMGGTYEDTVKARSEAVIRRSCSNSNYMHTRRLR
eukprot:749278-Hanusia_phi.AAC.5